MIAAPLRGRTAETWRGFGWLRSPVLYAQAAFYRVLSGTPWLWRRRGAGNDGEWRSAGKSAE
jgi:hypothetical protein